MFWIWISYIISWHFYLYRETTKIVARNTAKTAACVFWITAKAAACFQKGFITFITYNIVFIDFCVKHFEMQFLYEMWYINKVIIIILFSLNIELLILSSSIQDDCRFCMCYNLSIRWLCVCQRSLMPVIPKLGCSTGLYACSLTDDDPPNTVKTVPIGLWVSRGQDGTSPLGQVPTARH